MRLGVSLELKNDDPEAMARAYAAAGYAAAVCPPVSADQPERIRLIRQAFTRADVMLAEIGVWNNRLDPDPVKRETALQANIDRLALGDELGVRCCVNIAGSFNPVNWDGPHPKNLSAEAFDLTVENVRRILNTVKPRRTYYSLETMPWVFPDSPDSYLKLIEAVDHPMFAVHLDPVNLINSPARFYDNAGLLRECFAKLGRWIVSCHGKDILLHERLTVHLDEMAPGKGSLDYSTYLKELSRLPGEIPLILEHLSQEDYPAARQYVLDIAQQVGVSFHTPGGG
jgi:sugar phosphate isomerase/epimerase